MAFWLAADLLQIYPPRGLLGTKRTNIALPLVSLRGDSRITTFPGRLKVGASFPRLKFGFGLRTHEIHDSATSCGTHLSPSEGTAGVGPIISISVSYRGPAFPRTHVTSWGTLEVGGLHSNILTPWSQPHIHCRWTSPPNIALDRDLDTDRFRRAWQSTTSECCKLKHQFLAVNGRTILLLANTGPSRYPPESEVPSVPAEGSTPSVSSDSQRHWKWPVMIQSGRFIRTANA